MGDCDENVRVGYGGRQRQSTVLRREVRLGLRSGSAVGHFGARQIFLRNHPSLCWL